MFIILVHQGNWHGDVAIKILDMENMEEEGTLEAFRLDVATFRKTRHENLILFMGACMNPPKLAIVTSLCKGKFFLVFVIPKSSFDWTSFLNHLSLYFHLLCYF